MLQFQVDWKEAGGWGDKEQGEPSQVHLNSLDKRQKNLTEEPEVSWLLKLCAAYSSTFFFFRLVQCYASLYTPKRPLQPTKIYSSADSSR